MANEKFDTFAKSQQRFSERYTDMLWDDPDNKNLVGPGTKFPTKRSLTDFLERNNPHIEWIGQICGVTEKGTLITGNKLNVPVGFDYTEVQREIACRPVADVKDTPTPTFTPVAPAPLPPQAELAVATPQERLRRNDHAPDGKFVQPGTTHWAMERYADSGLNPPFTKAYYGAMDVAARIPVIFAKHSGQVGGNQPDALDSDFKKEGKRNIPFEESRESKRDDAKASADSLDGGRQRAFSTGYHTFTVVAGDAGQKFVEHVQTKERIALSEFVKDEKTGQTVMPESAIPLGTVVRLDKGVFDVDFGVAHDSGDLISILTTKIIPAPYVAVLTGEPSRHMPFDAELTRWGIGQTHVVLSYEDFEGNKTAFRDTQAKVSSPIETSDRIEARLMSENAQRAFTESMRAFETEQDATKRTQLATTAMTAWRDLSDNKLIVRVDAKTEAMKANEQGLYNYLAKNGVDVDAVRATVATAPRLEVRSMDQDLLEQLHDFAPNSRRYAGIKAGANFAPEIKAQLEASTYQRQNYAEAHIAKGFGNELNEEGMIAASSKAWGSIVQSEGAVKALGASMATNAELATAFGEALTDMKRNPKQFGFKNEKEAESYILQFAGADAKNHGDLRDVKDGSKPRTAGEELTADGDTFNVVIGRDERHNMQNPLVFGQAASGVIQSNPALFADAIGRMTDRSLTGEKSDGRNGGIGILRALASERTTTANEFGPTYKAMVAAGLSNEAEIRQTIVDAGVYGERGASGRTVNGFQRLDNLYVAAQYGALAATGDNRGVATEAEINSGAAKAKYDALGGKVNIFNTGAFDGSAVFDAAKAGNNAAIFNGLFASKEALEAGSAGLAVQALETRPVLGRDAVLATLVRDSQALNGAIARLHSKEGSVGNERYGSLARALESTRDSAEKYQQTGDAKYLTKAGNRLGDFFSDMEKNATRNGGAWRDNAWSAFITAASNDATATTGLLTTIAGDEVMRDAVIVGTPDALVAADATRGTNRGKLGKGNQLPANIRGDKVYQPRLVATDADNKFAEVVNTQLLAAVAAASPTAPVSALAYADVNAGNVAAATAANAAQAEAPLLTSKGKKLLAGIATGTQSPEDKSAAVDALNAGKGFFSRPLNAGELAELKALVSMGGTADGVKAGLDTFSTATANAGTPAAANAGATPSASANAGAAPKGKSPIDLLPPGIFTDITSSLAAAGVTSGASSKTAITLNVGTPTVLAGNNATASVAAAILQSGVPVPDAVKNAALSSVHPKTLAGMTPDAVNNLVASYVTTTLLNSGAINVTSTGELVNTGSVVNPGTDAALEVGSNLNGGAGPAKWWAAVVKKLTEKNPPKKTPNEETPAPPGCPECPRPTPPETPTLPTPPGPPETPTPPTPPTPPVVTPPESVTPVVPQPPALPPSVRPPEGATVGALDVTVPSVPGKSGVIQRG